MPFTLSDLFISTGLVGKAVFAVLVLMAFAALYIAAERWFTFFRMARQSHQFAQVVADLLKDQRYQDAVERAEDRAYQYSYLARLISMGLREFEGLRARSTRFDPADLISRALDRAMYAEALSMRKGLSALATIASTAPFVGMFGTLCGVAMSFGGISEASSAGYAPIFGGLASSLGFSALGVLVAIPAVWASNYLIDRVEGFEIQMCNSSAEIVDYCIRQISVTRGHTNPNA